MTDEVSPDPMTGGIPECPFPHYERLKLVSRIWSALKSLSSPKGSSTTDYEKSFVVELGDREITLQREGERISLKISEIDSIAIATTSDGPFICDVWYVIHAGENSMTVPMGATGEKALVDYLLARPGYDSKLL